MIIDADGHVEEDLAWIVKRLDPSLRPLAPRFERDADGRLVNLIEGRPWRPTFRLPRGSKTHTSAGGVERTGGRDPVERLRVLDAEGIDAAVLFPSMGLMYGLYEDPKPAAALCAANNVCFASDYPHFDAVYPGAIEAVRAHGLEPELERKVLADNALTFYGDRLRRIAGG